MVPMRDGVHLATDVYFPANDQGRLPGSFPVILERTPYGKSQRSRTERTHIDNEPMPRSQVAEYFVRRGYIVIYQDCRGRYRSEGEFTKYLDEAADGHDTCAWIVAQSWCDGNIGMKGLSYAAHTQMAAACGDGPGLRAMVVDSGGFSDGYQSGIRQGGAYELKQAAWAIMFAAEQSRRNEQPGIKLTENELEAWFGRMPWRRGDSPLTATPDYEEFLFDQWERGQFDEYWTQPGIYAKGYYDRLADVATVHISSWYDVYPRTAIDNFVGMRAHGTPCRLILGPWTHGNRWVTYSGDADFGENSRFESNIAENLLEFRARWFDCWLKLEDNGADDDPLVLIYVMGGGTGLRNKDGRLDHGGHWRTESTWPIPGTEYQRLYLTECGKLSALEPTAVTCFKEYHFDPRDPVPTVGGSVVSRPPSIVAGGFDQIERQEFFGCKQPGRPLASRDDVLVFESDELLEDVEVTGEVEVVLWISSDCPDTDFTAKLVDVYPPNADYPQGYALNITDGIIRVRYRDSWVDPQLMTPGELCEVRVRTLPTSNIFKRGHKLRLDVSSSNYPKFDLNPNTGDPEAKAHATRVAKNRVYLEKLHASHVVLPVLPRRELL